MRVVARRALAVLFGLGYVGACGVTSWVVFSQPPPARGLAGAVIFWLVFILVQVAVYRGGCALASVLLTKLWTDPDGDR